MTTMDRTPTAILQAQLLKAIIDEERTFLTNPNKLSDENPNKWLHIANIAFEKACQIEPDPQKRIDCMTCANEWITRCRWDFQSLKEVAKGNMYPWGMNRLFMELLKYGACLMIQPIVEQEASNKFNISSNSLRRSAYASQIKTGFIDLPEYLSEDYAIAEHNKHNMNKYTSYNTYSDDNDSDSEIKYE